MKKITLEDDWALVSEEEEIPLNPVETALKSAGKLGLGYKQLAQTINKRSVKYFIYNSDFIEDTPGILHGSLKNKIKVFRYTESKKKYFDRNKKQRVIASEPDPSYQ